MKMSQIIRDYIQENGFIKNVIADKSGIDRQKFYRIIAGTQNMTIEEYELICRKGLGIEPGYFFKVKFSKTENKRSA
jgi:hypothetical protein